MISNDILFVLYASSPLLTVEAEEHGMVCIVNITLNMTILLIWFGLSDLIINIYCLIVFVLPLRKIIELEKTTSNMSNMSNITPNQNAQFSLNVIIKKIIIFSTIALTSTIIFTLISMNVNKAASLCIYTFFISILFIFIHIIIQKIR